MPGCCAITGSTGHIGYALLKEFAARGETPRVLIRRDTAQLNGVSCEKYYGDITNPASLQQAFTGADTVFHLAGMIQVNTGGEEETWRVNVQGTANVVAACKQCGVKRLVYASSVDAYPPLPGNAVMAERTSFSQNAVEGVYAKTKAAATQQVLEAADDTLEVIIVYPGACIGPYDYKVSHIGEMVRMFLQGKFPVSLAFGAYNFVDVRDVAKGMLSAAERAKSGEGYILTGETVTVDGLMRLLGEICSETEGLQHLHAPKWKLAAWQAKLVAPFAEVYYTLAKKTPLFTRYSIRKLESNCNFSYQKATQEFGYTPMAIKQSLADMVFWILEKETIIK